VKEQHKVGKNWFHAPVVAANVLAVLKGEEAKNEYKPVKEFIFVTIGAVSRVLSFPDELAHYFLLK
jgi:hypothetical protein